MTFHSYCPSSLNFSLFRSAPRIPPSFMSLRASVGKSLVVAACREPKRVGGGGASASCYSWDGSFFPGWGRRCVFLTSSVCANDESSFHFISLIRVLRAFWKVCSSIVAKYCSSSGDSPLFTILSPPSMNSSSCFACEVIYTPLKFFRGCTAWLE